MSDRVLRRLAPGRYASACGRWECRREGPDSRRCQRLCPDYNKADPIRSYHLLTGPAHQPWVRGLGMSGHDSGTPPAQQVEYRDAVGFIGYRVGADGSVWSCWQRAGPKGEGVLGTTWRQLKPYLQYGYPTVTLKRGKSQVARKVHRLVLAAFVGPCPEGTECCHWDGDRTNNHVQNLRWGTRKENADDRERQGRTLRGEEAPFVKLSGEQVIEVVRMCAAGASMADAARRFKVTPGAIRRIIRGYNWKHLTASLQHLIPPLRKPLSDDAVRDIRRRAAAGEARRLIAADYGICRAHVNGIVRREKYPHVT